MPNTYKNKVVYNGRTLIDLTHDTVTKPEHVLHGYKFHTAKGRQTTGTAEPPLKDVNFYDFTGRRLFSYTAEEAQALTEMPNNSLDYDFINRDLSTDGLESDGWNYTLTQMQTTVSQCNKCDVGGLYRTVDGIDGTEIAPTLIYCNLCYRNIFNLTLCVNGTVTISFIICYGSEDYDSVSYTLNGTSLNSYVTMQIAPPEDWIDNSADLDYIIRIEPWENTQFRFYSTEQQGSLLFSKHPSTATAEENAVFQSAIHAIELGDGIESISDYAFKNLVNLETITFPSYINRWGTDGANIARGTFDNCYKLKHVNFPYGLTSPDCFENCIWLKTVSLPNSLTHSGNFHGSGIERICYPDSMYYFTSDFSDCKNLKSIYMRSVMSWSSSASFNNCVNLEDINTGVAGYDTTFAVPDYLFCNCIKLPFIPLYNNLSLGNSSFKNCRGRGFCAFSLSYTLETIGNSCFEGCNTIKYLELQQMLSSIGSKAFKDCYGLKIIVLTATTPPTIQSDTFENLPSDCIIYVPDGCLSNYTSAPYWSVLASQIQEGYPGAG